MKVPEGVEDKYLVLMGDIFPTGYFAAYNAFKNSTLEQIAHQTVVLIGCGPVGLCALINALEYKPKHLLAVDSVPSRLELAKSLGAEPWNFMTDRAGLDKRVKELTNGRGADAVIEVVGLSPALRTAYELLRPWGTISSVGVHNAEVSIKILVIRARQTYIGFIDPLGWQRCLQQEPHRPNGPLSRPVSLRKGPRGAEEEPAQTGVSTSFE